jgi:hypothetical protein
MKRLNQEGYVALISVIVISALLIGISSVLSFSGFFGRFNVLDSEFKEVSIGLAEACADQAVLFLAENPAYTPPAGGQSVGVGSETCTIDSITGSWSPKTIYTQGIFHESYTNLEVEVSNSADVTVTSWQEIANLP